MNKVKEEYKEKVIETLWNHYKTNGGYTRMAAQFIEKLTGEKWERDKEYDALKELLNEFREEIKLRETTILYWQDKYSQYEDNLNTPNPSKLHTSQSQEVTPASDEDNS